MEIKSKMKAHYVKVGIFNKVDEGNYEPAGYKWMRVRTNGGIPNSHKMFQ